MRERLAQARTREETRQEAAMWLAEHDPGDGHGRVGHPIESTALFGPDVVLDAFAAGAEMATEDCSKIHRAEQDDWAVELAAGQRQLDDATSLIREAAGLFRTYQQHHLDQCVDKAARDPRDEERREKAGRNGLMAARLEAWLRGESIYPITADGAYAAHARFRQPAADTPGEDTAVAHGERVIDLPGVVSREQAERVADWRRNGPFGSNVRPVTAGPLADPDVVEGLLAASGQIDATEDVPFVMGRKPRFALHTGDPRFDPAQPLTVNGYTYHPATEARREWN